MLVSDGMDEMRWRRGRDRGTMNIFSGGASFRFAEKRVHCFSCSPYFHVFVRSCTSVAEARGCEK